MGTLLSFNIFIAMKYYEVDFVEMDGNRVTRDFRHFTDENEAKQMFNDLKDNPEIVKVTRNELFKGDGENYLGGSEERESAVNKETDLHRIFLNSRLGDKRFIEEPIMSYFSKRNRARKEFLLSPELNEFDDKSMKAYGDAMKVALGSGEKSTSIEKIYMDMLKNELPSQDEVNDAFEKFERETHYLNNKPVGEWDATDMSNWKSILRKNGKLFMSVKESMAKYRVSYTKKDSSKVSIDYIGGLNAEDSFYELMDDDDVISAKIEYVRGDEAKVTDTWSRDKDGKVDIKVNL